MLQAVVCAFLVWVSCAVAVWYGSLRAYLRWKGSR